MMKPVKTKFVTIKADSKKLKRNLQKLGKNSQRWANAANYAVARDEVFLPSVYMYAPHSGAKNYGRKQWGYRLTDEASLSTNRVGKLAQAIIAYDAPQSLLLHELGYPPSPFWTRPGSQPDFLRAPMDQVERVYLKKVGMIIDEYIKGRKIDPMPRIRGNRGR